MARDADFRLPIEFVHIDGLVVGSERVHNASRKHPFNPAFVVAADRVNTLGPFELLQRFARRPSKRRPVFQRVFLIGFRFVEARRMHFAKPDPFDLLLVKTEETA